MKFYFENVNSYEIRGMSLFIAIDSLKKEYVCKLIDLSSFRPMAFDRAKGKGRDFGLIKGIESLIAILTVIQNADMQLTEESKRAKR